MGTGGIGIFQELLDLTESVMLVDKDTKNADKTTAKTLQSARLGLQGARIHGGENSALRDALRGGRIIVLKTKNENL